MAENIADLYLEGLRAVWEALGEDAWHEVGEEAPLPLLATAQGASDADLTRLRTAYPLCPEALVELLRKVDGTECAVLGSDAEDGDCGYCLKSVDQILTSAAHDWRATTIREEYGEDFEVYRANDIDSFHADYSKASLDGRIDPDVLMNRWLHFADDWANSGGSSQLYVDFDPLGDGPVGQVVRFLHDPDSFDVVADSFDEYLQQLIDSGYPFALPI